MRRNLITDFTLPKSPKIKGYVETSGAGAWTIDESLNVTSITDNGAGDFTINWTTAFDSANYAVFCSMIGTTVLWMGETSTTAKSASVVRFELEAFVTATLTDPSVGVSVIALEL